MIQGKMKPMIAWYWSWFPINHLEWWFEGKIIMLLWHSNKSHQSRFDVSISWWFFEIDFIYHRTFFSHYGAFYLCWSEKIDFQRVSFFWANIWMCVWDLGKLCAGFPKLYDTFLRNELQYRPFLARFTVRKLSLLCYVNPKADTCNNSCVTLLSFEFSWPRGTLELGAVRALCQRRRRDRSVWDAYETFLFFLIFCSV